MMPPHGEERCQPGEPCPVCNWPEARANLLEQYRRFLAQEGQITGMTMRGALNFCDEFVALLKVAPSTRRLPTVAQLAAWLQECPYLLADATVDRSHEWYTRAAEFVLARLAGA